ncbi:MAG: antitoxin VbhA family protein [Oscillospiraceae bacterium]|nr:antitoxin VbhA family protein [Oscillospiraceae bacterium]
MKYKNISRENLNRSIIASLKIEGLNPSKEAVNLTDRVIDGTISKDEAIAQIFSKYKVNSNSLS